MRKNIHSEFMSFYKLCAYILLILLLFNSNDVNAQATQVYNDAGIRLRVWLHAVYSDANCSENAFSGASTKFMFNNLQIRASNGTNFRPDMFPAPNLFTNPLPQDMRFRTKSSYTNRFWKTNDSQFRMVNPYYPFERSTFPINQQVIAGNATEKAPFNYGAYNTALVTLGLQSPDTLGFLLYDRSFPVGGKAPDRYEWIIKDIFESDADISGDEAGGLNLFGAGCTKAFGLPQAYEGRKFAGGYDPLLSLLLLDSLGVGDLILWASYLGGCTNLFGFDLDFDNIWNQLSSIVLGINDFDDSYGNKTVWGTDPAFFRGTAPGQIGYFTSQKILATDNRDEPNEGYILVFAHQWEWTGTAYSEEPLANAAPIQAELCPAERYTEDDINLQVWLDGYFTDSDHEGSNLPVIGSLLQCNDLNLGPERMTGTEEKYIRARARTQFTGMPAWNPTIKNNQDRPQWISTNQSLLNYSFSESGMNTFHYEIESWESDCWTESPTNCDVCIIGSQSDNCCVWRENIPFVGSTCIIPGIGIDASDNDRRAITSGTVNWRNSPPGVDNYIYVPISISGSRYQSHLAKIRYRWTIPNPVAGTVDGARDVILCPGQTHTMNVTGSKNATWYQWQYAAVDGPAGPACPPSGTQWINVPANQGGICPTGFTTQPFTGTRYYRLLVYNRNGPGSKTPDGNKFAYDSTVCTRISILDSVQVPIDAPIACGTAANPTTVRAGSSITLRPVLPPAPGSIDIPGIRYEWSAGGGATVSTPVPAASPWQTSLTFPSSSPTVVSVTLHTINDRCPFATQRDTSCYFITEDPGCSGVTGVIYVSHSAAPGGIGTISRPFTLNDGFALVETDPNITHVKILAGNYVIDSTSYGAMKLRNNIVVEGNYIEEFDSDLGEYIWVKRSDAVTNITSNITERINDSTIHTIGFRATGNGWTLQDINITTGNSPNRDALLYKYTRGNGLSNYAIHVHGSTDWRMINVNAVSGQAGVGSTGQPRVETCPEAVIPALRAANSRHYNAPNNGVGNNNHCGSRGGGSGGEAGYAGTIAVTSSAPYGLGGTYPGGNGNDGFIGNAGTIDGSRSIGDLTGQQFFIAKGQNMINVGGNGGGGGGGAGSASAQGSAGGIGGIGGNPGFGSGTSFGIWLSGNSVGRVRNFSSSVTTFAPVMGGEGGPGGPGYPPGLAPAGAGVGGYGGPGGQGGYGAMGGVDGSNRAEYVQPGSQYLVDGPSQPAPYNVANQPYPSPRIESDYASGCTNSKITIRKPTGTTWAGLTALDYPDISPGVSTSPLATSNPKVIYYPSTGVQKLEITPGGQYFNQLYIRYERPLPTITVPNRICSGTPIDLSSTPGMDDPIDHEWVIQQGVPLAPYATPAPVIQITGEANPSGVLLPVNNTGLPITYQVRYRVRDNCCGWSIPIYSTIEVLPEINNVIRGVDSFMCNIGDPGLLSTNPVYPVPAGSWSYQWYSSFNGGPYTAISPNGNTQNYDPPVLSTSGTYTYMRVIGSTVATCADTSNTVSIVVTENFTDNNIDFPVPFTADCGPSNMPSFSNATEVSVAHVNVGLMNGSVPTGPGNANTFYYQWQKSIDTLNWSNLGSGFPVESGAPFGVGTNAQSINPGSQTPSGGHNYGPANQIFPQSTPGSPGYILFRRIVQRVAGDFVCADTSNFVAAEVFPGRSDWANCPQPSDASSNALCRANYPILSAINGYTGTCMLIAPDTVCPGTSITVELPTTLLGTRTYGAQFAWYKATGGPFNRNPASASTNPCAISAECTNPMLNFLCGNNKPEKSDFITFTPYDTGGTVLSVLLDTTTTFYVNTVSSCFSDAVFRNMPTTSAANRSTIENYANKWQRKTVITVTPFTMITDFRSSDTLLCGDNVTPDSITLSIVGGTLGNDGWFEIFDTNPEVGGPHVPIHQGAKRDETVTGRQIKIPRPATTTTYYARISNRCNSSPTLQVIVRVVDESIEPDSLVGPDVACGGESITLTVHGGSLGEGAKWVLYNGDPTASGVKLDSNFTGIFTQTPSINTIYYVRAEAPMPCLFTDAVSKAVAVIDTCVCDINPGYVEYAPDGSTTIATIECEDSDGWTWYATVDNPNEYLFAIMKRPSAVPNANTLNFTAEVRITVTANPSSMDDVFYAESGCEGNFIMPRYWNVNLLSGNTNGFVKTRFFFKPSELDATRARALSWLATNQPSCELLLDGPNQVFKHTDHTLFFAGPTTPLNVPVNQSTTSIQATTINNFNYVAHLFSNLPNGSVGTIDGKNYVEVAWDGFSGGGVSIRVSPDLTVLPVTLVSFTGSLIDDKVYLQWETASELNNDYFLVEKSINGRDWSSIGTVKGNGTTSQPHQYSLWDTNPYVGTNYYRLKQVDFDGSFNYSNIIQVDLNTSGLQNFVQIYPNPTDGIVNANIQSKISQKVKIRIMDISGKLLIERYTSVSKGGNTLKLNLSDYPASSYIISFTDEDGKEHNVKVVKQ